jgi:O-antigen ligase
VVPGIVKRTKFSVPRVRRFRPYVALPTIAARKPTDFKWAFTLFLLVTATLFVRPAEIIPALAGAPLFQVFIIGSALLAWPALLEVLRWKSLRAHPAALCVVGLVPAILLSDIMRGNFGAAEEGLSEFIKVLIYFLLLVALVNSPARFRKFLFVTATLIFVTATVATLRYHGLLNVDAITVLARSDNGIDEETGLGIVVTQLQASGLFSDPNDFSLVLVTAVLAFLHFLTEAKTWGKRLILCLPLGLVSYAFALTRSRGGFLSLLAGLGVWMIARLGWRRAVPLGVLLLPVILVLFAGRQTNINLDENDTAQSRIKLWREGVTYFKNSPVWGIGYQQYAEQSGEPAHNSYIHTDAELGFFGGTLFLGAFLLPIVACKRAIKPGVLPKNDELGHLPECVMAITAAYAVGLFSLSRPYACSTYMILGLASAMCYLLARRAPSAVPPLNYKVIKFLVLSNAAWMAFMFVFIRFVAH